MLKLSNVSPWNPMDLPSHGHAAPRCEKINFHPPSHSFPWHDSGKTECSRMTCGNFVFICCHCKMEDCCWRGPWFSLDTTFTYPPTDATNSRPEPSKDQSHTLHGCAIPPKGMPRPRHGKARQPHQCRVRKGPGSQSALTCVTTISLAGKQQQVL